MGAGNLMCSFVTGKDSRRSWGKHRGGGWGGKRERHCGGGEAPTANTDVIGQITPPDRPEADPDGMPPRLGRPTARPLPHHLRPGHKDAPNAIDQYARVSSPTTT
ncbi:hypothetical protein GCM10020221_18250 [Streptomyces thioluteus]|uniref:Uncharacterized protein n=1 Tax=Streptomyces thioluteus TaxID=66431 RepID=A0ABP6J633_STRTU